MTDDEFMAAERERFERIGRRTGKAFKWSVIVAIATGVGAVVAWWLM